MVSISYFDKTVDKAKTLILNKRDKNYLAALYKQVKEGDAPIDNSNITDPDELDIWNEWNKLRGSYLEIIMNKYCDYITLIINWQQKNIYKYD